MNIQGMIVTVVMGMGLVFGVSSCRDSAWYSSVKKELNLDKDQIAAAKLARETPHVIREKDGCKVYEFENRGNTHYFTRCPATTDTETNWTVSCGKNKQCPKQDNIVTINEKVSK